MRHDRARLGVILLCHTALHRASQVARHWAEAGCHVALHVDANVTPARYREMATGLADLDTLSFIRRRRCPWGSWNIVAATQAAARHLLATAPQITHVLLASGSCLPLRTVGELRAFLDSHASVDFIESVSAADVTWSPDGLNHERFTLYFPFDWRKHRFLFDRSVALQRRFGVSRRVPAGLVPHLGSQWWCLTRQTVTEILNAPDRTRDEAYFKQVWIPDESYFQTLARRYGRCVENRSLTYSKFDFQGKPHLFYDDHLAQLQASGCFVARKIWPGADGLYNAFLGPGSSIGKRRSPQPEALDRMFARADEKRTKGRPGLVMQSRDPNPGWENGTTVAPYTVLLGFTEVFEDFEAWLAQATRSDVHGHLFAKERVALKDGVSVVQGALSNDPKLRDSDPGQFLRNLIWNCRGRHQSFQFGPEDDQSVWDRMLRDPNATIRVISGAWIISLWQNDRSIRQKRQHAARLQGSEAEMLFKLRSHESRANVEIVTLAGFLRQPASHLLRLMPNIETAGMRPVQALPRLVDTQGLANFVATLRKEGMHLYLAGDLAQSDLLETDTGPARRDQAFRGAGT